MADFLIKLYGRSLSLQLFITVHFNEDLKKSFLIDQRMTCLDICQSLAEKSETKLSADCALVERLPELNIGKTSFLFPFRWNYKRR